MGFFQKIGGAFARFMYGRNGWDQLNQALFRGYLALWIAEIVCGLLRWGLAARVLEAVLFSLMLIIFFRMFSKDLYRRRTENQKWVNWYCGMKNRNAGAKARHADKEHKYFTCRQCRTICRVPVGKGKIVITCPKCGAQIQAKT
ncbi:hypothetical protein [uncultured Oscillibacter sp.]|uniref:hypothetical protein n=1 Tax=uncultured Oscillibacter sp. TaxID=876091 RepID=UPI0025FF4B22|nr:hypothetical protein [uncultured Oscillibacter sp.]